MTVSTVLVIITSILKKIHFHKLLRNYHSIQSYPIMCYVPYPESSNNCPDKQNDCDCTVYYMDPNVLTFPFYFWKSKTANNKPKTLKKNYICVSSGLACADESYTSFTFWSAKLTFILLCNNVFNVSKIIIIYICMHNKNTMLRQHNVTTQGKQRSVKHITSAHHYTKQWNKHIQTTQALLN